MSSPKSFYSMSSHKPDSAYPPQPSQPGPQTPSQRSIMSNLQDVDAWLANTDNVAMLDNIAKKAAQNNASVGTAPVQSVTGVDNPSETISLFTMACQSKGITPVFDYREERPQRFTGTLRLGSETVELTVGMRNKKEAKAWMAKQGLSVLDSMEKPTKKQKLEAQPAVGANNGINWIGKLLEYSNSLAVPLNVTYEPENALNGFTCSLTIAPSPIEPGTNMHFALPEPLASKKAAKSAVSEIAVRALIAAGKLEVDGSIKKAPSASKPSSGSLEKTSSNEDNLDNSESNTARVNKLYPSLGLPPPTYKIEASDPNIPALFSGAAYFQGHPLKVNGQFTSEGGPIGVVRHVHGKKAAKEECARGVLEFLEALQKARADGIK